METVPFDSTKCAANYRSESLAEQLLPTNSYKFQITGTGYLKYVYDNINKIYKNLTMAQENVKKILRSISEWSSAPMYKRKDGNIDLCLDIFHAENRIKIQNEKIDITEELIQRSMHENFNLFFDVESIMDGNKSNSKVTKCNHNLVKKRMELVRSIGKSSEDFGTKVR